MPYKTVFPSPSVVVCIKCGYSHWNCFSCAETKGTECNKNVQHETKTILKDDKHDKLNHD